MYLELGEYEKCLSDFNTSYNIKPRNSVLYFKYELYELLNDYDNSIKYLKELRNKSKLKFDSNLLLLEKLKSMESGKFSL